MNEATGVALLPDCLDGQRLIAANQVLCSTDMEKLQFYKRTDFTLFCTAFVAFAVRMSTTVAGGDSGELIVNAARAGIIHPPGYPLYSLLAGIFGWLSQGNPALAINLFSVICSAGAAVLVFKTVELITENWLAGILAAYVYISFLPILHYSGVAEVFALNNLIVAVVLYCFVGFLNRKSWNYLLWGSFLSALGICNHHTSIFVTLPLGLAALIVGFRLFREFKKVLLLIAAILLGLVPYLFLFLLDNSFIASWGDLSNWNGFLTHLLRKEYGTFQLASDYKGVAKFTATLWFFTQTVLISLSPLAFVFAVWGIKRIVLKRDLGAKHSLWLLMLPVCLVTYILVFSSLSNLDPEQALNREVVSRFWQLPGLLLAVLVGIGWKDGFGKRHEATVIPLMALLLIVWNYQLLEEKREGQSVNQFARSILTNLPENSLLLLRGDLDLNSMRYLQEIEDLRPDVKVIGLDILFWPWNKAKVEKRYPDLRIPADRFVSRQEQKPYFSLRQLVNGNIKDMPVFINQMHPEERVRLRNYFDIFRWGWIEELRPRGRLFDPVAYADMALKSMDHYRPGKARKGWPGHLDIRFWDSKVKTIAPVLEIAVSKKDPKMLQAGTDRLARILNEYPNPPENLKNNLEKARDFLRVLQQ